MNLWNFRTREETIRISEKVKHCALFPQATNLLKKAEGVVTLTVCNPNQSKVAKEEEDRAKGIVPEPEGKCFFLKRRFKIDIKI